MVLINAFHGFSSFLGSIEGELFKRSLELLLFAFITYMITSRYKREKSSDLKFLIIAFGAMAFQKLVSVMALFLGTFGNITIFPLKILVTFDHSIEVAALFLLVGGFIYPMIRDKEKKIKQFLLEELRIILLISLFCFICITLMLLFQNIHNVLFITISNIIFIKIVILIYSLLYIFFRASKEYKYKNSILVGLGLYTVTPVLMFLNFMFSTDVLWMASKSKIIVASHPFPFLAVLVFTRMIFLRLADKATLKQELEESRKKYIEEKEISKLKDEFISTVSHELRTPITSMKLYLSLLAKGKFGNMADQQKDALKIINEENDRLNTLINDILNLSKLEAKKEKLNKTKFNLHNITKNNLYLQMAQQKQINIVNKIPEDLVVKADYDKIIQVFINLFNNAIKFTPENGTILLEAKDLKTKWLFSIKDTGVGIPKDVLPKLFNKFYQAESYMTRKQSGSGLGLAIVKQIVDMHKGKIEVKSKINKGTKITLMFPKR